MKRKLIETNYQALIRFGRCPRDHSQTEFGVADFGAGNLEVTLENGDAVLTGEL